MNDEHLVNAYEIDRLRRELETEREKRLAAEKRCFLLEKQLRTVVAVLARIVVAER